MKKGVHWYRSNSQADLDQALARKTKVQISCIEKNPNFSSPLKSKVQIKIQKGTTEQGEAENGGYRSTPGGGK